MGQILGVRSGQLSYTDIVLKCKDVWHNRTLLEASNGFHRILSEHGVQAGDVYMLCNTALSGAAAGVSGMSETSY